MAELEKPAPCRGLVVPQARPRRLPPALLLALLAFAAASLPPSRAFLSSDRRVMRFNIVNFPRLLGHAGDEPPG